MSERFTLDEARAAEWLAAQVEQFDRYNDGDGTDPGELEIGSDFDPRETEGGHDVSSLMYYARGNGYLTGPGAIEFDYCEGRDEIGYCWLVYLDLDEPGESLKLSSLYNKIKWLGDEEYQGAEAALDVLRSAVADANRVLDDLDRYVASRGGN